MTDSSPRNRAGQLFASDLRSIREQQGVAIKDILDATRLAEDVIEQFEETALLDNPVFNRVYLRSLVSSYARLIDIDEKVALQGLEDTLRGEYEGALGKIYLSDVSPAKEADSGEVEGAAATDVADADKDAATDPADADKDAATDVAKGDDATDLADAAGESGTTAAIDDSDTGDASEHEDNEKDTTDVRVSSDASDKDASDEDVPDEDATVAPAPGETGAPTDPASSSSAERAESDDSEASDDSGEESDSTSLTDLKTGAAPGAAVDRSAGTRVSGSSVLSPSETGKGLLLPDMRGLVAAIVAGVVLIALVWISVAWFLDNPEEETLQEDAVPAVDSTTAEPEPTPEPVVLPDTFEVHVIALDEPLDPIRSRVDNDLRRPYWVELGDTLTFRASDTVTLEREVDHALVLIESYMPPERWLEPDGQYVISRQRTQAWLDSLVAAGIFPPESPDSLNIPGLREDSSESTGGSGSGGAAPGAVGTGSDSDPATDSDPAGTGLDPATDPGSVSVGARRDNGADRLQSEDSPDTGRRVTVGPNTSFDAPTAAR